MRLDECKKEQSSFIGEKVGLLFVFLLVLCLGVRSANASTTNGTIDSTNRYAYSENAGWIDFATSGGNVQVNDSGLTGYAYGENIGWISLNCSNTSSCGTVNYGVSNDGSGNLSGYAYGENIGWIDFHPNGAGVTIDSNGIFHGSAYGENVGWITFNCADTSSCGTVNYTISTDWRPASVRNAGGGGGSVTTSVIGGGGGSSNPNPATPPLFQPANCPPGFICTLNTNSTVTTTTNSSSSCPIFNNAVAFNRNLKVGSVGEDVRNLQIKLNHEGFVVAATGAGSICNESTFFGAKTKLALSKWQKAHGISPPVGYFGPKTRAAIEALNI